MLWEDVPETIDDWAEKTASPATDIRRAVARVYTHGDIGYYWNPEFEKAAMFARMFPTTQDVTLCKMALDRAVGKDSVEPELLTDDQLNYGGWVKVAYSPTLRRVGELLNFFPGRYPGGIPNAPSPLAATLTGGLVGAGLGYGAGWLGEKLLPEKWRRGRLRRFLAMLGGGIGAAPGALWSFSALRRGRGLLDGSDLSQKPGTMPIVQPPAMAKVTPDYGDPPEPRPTEPPYRDLYRLPEGEEEAPLSDVYKTAVDSFVKRAFADTLAMAAPYRPKTPIDVNVNKMGHTLWEVGASPQTAATTMGALYAAQQMPDPNSRPGHVTPHQGGMLATAMGAAKGYAGGYLAARALGVATGAPAGFQDTLAKGGALLGIVNTVVPRFFN